MSKAPITIIGSLVALGVVVYALISPTGDANKKGSTEPLPDTAAKRSATPAPANLPPCDSNEATTALRMAFNTSEIAGKLKLSAVEAKELKETSYDPANKRRSCTALVTLSNTSKAGVKFNLESRETGGYVLTFEVWLPRPHDE